MNNEYTKRKTALKDMQPCIICQKPTSTVLYDSSGPDWIFTCDIHLLDNPQFVTPSYSEEYHRTVKRVNELQQKVNQSNGKRNANESWDFWVSKYLYKKKEDKMKEDQEDTNRVDLVSNDDASTDSMAASIADIRREYSQALDKMTELQRNNKKYKLSKTMFEFRLQKRRQQEIALARQKKEAENYSNTDPEELTKKFNFPSTPTTNPSTKKPSEDKGADV